MSNAKRNDILTDDAVKDVIADLVNSGIDAISMTDLYRKHSGITLQNIASDANTPPKLLAAFVEHTVPAGSFSVPMNLLTHVAANPSTPVRTLAKLSKMKNPSIMAALAGNPSTSTFVLDRLFSYFIKPFVEGNSHGSSLASFFAVLSKLISNPSISREALQTAYDTNDRDLYVMLAASEATPDDMLLLLSNTHDILTLRALATNMSAPYELVAELARSKRLRGEVAKRKDVAAYIEHLDFSCFDTVNAKALAQAPYATIELIDMLALTHGELSPMVNMAACASKLCSASNVLDVMSSYPNIAIHLAPHLFDRDSGKYEQFASYILVKHEVDITSIPDNMVYELMGWVTE
jgi:hypothetical protein